MTKKIGRIIKYICLAFILFITCLLVWRMCAYSNLPAEMETLSWNSTTAAAYEEHGEDMKVLELNMPDKYRIAPDGKFSVRAVYYLPEANQLQLTLCYNDSTLDALEEETGKTYDFTDFPFATLLLGDDDKGYWGARVAYAEKGVYNYERWIFDMVDISEVKELALTLRLASSESTEQYSAVAVYHSEIPSTPKKLTKADLAGYESLS